MEPTYTCLFEKMAAPEDLAPENVELDVPALSPIPSNAAGARFLSHLYRTNENEQVLDCMWNTVIFP